MTEWGTTCRSCLPYQRPCASKCVFSFGRPCLSSKENCEAWSRLRSTLVRPLWRMKLRSQAQKTSRRRKRHSTLDVEPASVGSTRPLLIQFSSSVLIRREPFTDLLASNGLFARQSTHIRLLLPDEFAVVVTRVNIRLSGLSPLCSNTLLSSTEASVQRTSLLFAAHPRAGVTHGNSRSKVTSVFFARCRTSKLFCRD